MSSRLFNATAQLALSAQGRSDHIEWLQDLGNLASSTVCKVERAWLCATVGFTCRAADERYVAAVGSCLYPHLRDAPAGTPRFTFTIVANSRLLKRFEAIAPPPSGTPVLTYCRTESGTVRLAQYEVAGASALRSTKTDCLLVADAAFTEVVFLTSEEYWERPTLYKDGAAFLEHLLHKHSDLLGNLVLHASAVVLNDQAVLFSGPKRSGKTTMLFEAVLRHGASPLSVDKVHLRHDASGGMMVEGFPTRLRALPGTLAKYGETFRDLIPSRYRDISREERWRGESESKVDIPLAEFEKRVQRPTYVSAPLAMVVLPTLGSEVQPSSRFVAQRCEIAELLSPNVYTPDNPEEDWWSGVGRASRERILQQRERMLDLLAATTPVMQIEASDDLTSVLRAALCNMTNERTTTNAEGA